jgi:hypothetical protein
MQCRLISILCLIASMFSIGAVAQEALTGAEIMSKVDKKNEITHEYKLQAMTLIDRKGNEKQRVLRQYRLQDAEGLNKYLMVFDQPSAVAGVALLTLQQADGDDLQYLYLPAHGKRLKRTAKGNNSNSFLGTDFTFEDLSSDDMDNYTHKRQEDTKIQETACFVVDSYPKGQQRQKDSAYLYRRIYVNQEHFYIMSVDYYNKRGKLLKQLSLSDFKMLKPGVWRASDQLMHTLKSQHKTLVKILERDIDAAKVTSNLFTKRWITSGRYLKK